LSWFGVQQIVCSKETVDDPSKSCTKYNGVSAGCVNYLDLKAFVSQTTLWMGIIFTNRLCQEVGIIIMRQ
jgi:hypothetical protein